MKNKESETCKTAAAQLLENLCDHIDGCLSFVGVICTQIINYSLRSNKPEDLSTKFLQLQRYANCSFLISTPQEIRVESCLVIFSVLSYVIPKRQDIL